MKVVTALCALALLFVAAPAVLADAPQPIKPVPVGLYSGRWYEIARTPNQTQADCQDATSDFSGWASGAFSVVQTCHKGSAGGPRKVFNAHGRILPATNNAKMRLGFFGGLISQDYWILDHADDNTWAIMGTPGGHYVWLLSRRPMLDAGAKARALGRMQSLGFNLSHLAFPAQLPG